MELIPKSIFDIFTLLGFLITCFVLADIKKLKKSFGRKARVPEIVKDLEKIFSDIKKSLSTFKSDNKPTYQKIYEARGLITSIRNHLTQTEESLIVAFLDLTARPDDFKESEDACWDIYSKLSEIIANIKQLEKDIKWN